MLLWSWMLFFRKIDGHELNRDLLIRLIHFYYIRYNCFKRSTTSLETIVTKFFENDGSILSIDASGDIEEEDNANNRIYSEEEVILSNMYQSIHSDRNFVESKIWELQDLPYFLDGHGVGGNTIYDYVNPTAGIVDMCDIINSIDKLKENIIFLLGEKEPQKSELSTLKSLLLFYSDDHGLFWQQQSPYYYCNYETCLWKRIIRTPYFISFYKEYVSLSSSGQINSLEDLLKYKRCEFFNQKENQTIVRDGKPWSHRKLCILYDVLCPCGVWENIHENVSFVNKEDNKEEVFMMQESIFRAYRYKDSNAYVGLVENWRETLQKLYPGIQVIDTIEELQQ